MLSTGLMSPPNKCITLECSNTSAEMDFEDPWCWDIDRVVTELCTESRSWTSDTVRSRRRPNFVALEVALRAQQIDGATLLTEVTDAVLKEELGIKVLGQLAPVKQIIWDLRRESTRYRDWLGKRGSEMSLASHVPYTLSSAPHARKRSVSPLLYDTPLQVSSRISSTRQENGENDVGPQFKNDAAGDKDSTYDRSLQMDPWVADATGSKRRKLDSEVDHTFSSLTDHSHLENSDGATLSNHQPFQRNGSCQGYDDSLAALPTTENTFSTETLSPTKKPRRIAPTLVTSEIDMTRDREIPTEADTVINHDPQNIEPGVIYLGDDGKKRLIPISQSGQDMDLPRRHQELLQNRALAERSAINEGGRQGLEAAGLILGTAKQHEDVACADALSAGYLGKMKCPVNEIFYGTTGIGKELPLGEDEDREIKLFTRGTVSAGRRRYVHGLVKKFLRSERQIIHRDGKIYSALCPYPARLAPMHHSPSFTLFSKDVDGNLHATREVLSKWPDLDRGPTNDMTGFQDYDDRHAHFDLPDNLLLGGPSSYDNWNPDLLEKYRYIDGGDAVLPLYGDSDEEGEYDQETWREIEEERGTLEKPLLPLRRTPLTNSEVNAAIDEGIALMIVAWHNKQLPKLQRRAWSLWKMSRKKSQKRELVRKAKEYINKVNNERLPKMREEFLRDRWVNKKQVLRVTKVMELTIFHREEFLWQLSVIKSSQEPERPPPREPKPEVSHPSTFADGNDGECIITDTETQSSDVEGDFIDDAAESVDEAEHSRADDEADDPSISDEAGYSQSLRDSEMPIKGARTPLMELFKDIPDAEENCDSEDELMIGVSSNVAEDEKINFPQSDMSITPQLPLRPAADDQGGIHANIPAASNQNFNASQEATLDIIDLTILPSDTSAGEKSPGTLQTINSTTPEKRKKNLRISFNRKSLDAYASSDVMEISHGEASDIPPNYLTLTDPAAIAKIPRRKWEEAGDKDRLLIGELFRIMPGRKEELSELFSQLTLTQMWSGMFDVMHAFRKGKDRVQGMDSKTYTGLTGVMRLFETYAVGRTRRNRKKLKPAEIEKILEKEELFPHFHQICRKTFDRLLSKAKEAGDEEDEDPLPASRRKFRASSESTSGSEENEQNSAYKTRKKKLFENAQARDRRQQDQQRLLEQEERRRILQDKLARTGSSVTAGQKRIIINDAKHDDQGFIYVHEQISRRIKDHQIDGVRFMWSQIVTNGDAMQGCLLAHTMGLGKTMQVITLLVAIAEAAKSPDVSISSQIPPSLHLSKTLVLCPPGLIDNWMDELLIWAPQGILGEYRKFDSALKAKTVRLDAIENWYTNGGVLIMSYDMFRKLIHNNSTQKMPAPLDENEHAQVREHLLQGPNIIIADEAHKMKNPNASITQAAIQFRSSSRIALTGSPLANNVVEYHTMIEWIAPNYLGPIAEFRAKYVEPIQQGSYFESTASERRKSLKMLSILRKDLEPKVHRADISVLRRDLKPKTEFVITVPLTELQHKAYSIYVKSMLGNDHEVTKDGQIQLSTLWHWLAILSLLCNHPTCFKAKLSERKDDAEKKIRGKSMSELATPKASTSEDDNGPGDISVWKIGVSEELVRQEMDLFQQFGSAVEEFYSSNKVKLLLQILDASKAVGDKVLIFSQSIQTLDFLERLCRRTSRKYARLDGSTKMSSRQGLTKDFNTGDAELYLISTTAGGIGLNLPGANRVIIFDFKFNPVNEEQAVGRAYRLGQQKPVFVYRFVAGGTFEESIHNTAVFKMQLASKVVDKKNPLAWAKKRTGEFLFEPKVVKQQDLSGFKGRDPFVLDKILGSQEEDSTIRAIVITDTFERHDHEELTAEEQQEVLQEVNDEKLKRSNKSAWDALVQKRAQASKPQHSAPYQAAQKQGQRLSVSNSTLEHPPILPTKVPASPRHPHSSISTQTQNALKPVMPEMAPVAGVNTKIREPTPPLNKSPALDSTGSTSVPFAASSEARKGVLSHDDDASDNTVGLRRPLPSNPFKALARGATVNEDLGVRGTQLVKDPYPQQLKRVSLRASSAPDHKRSLSGDQEGSDAADRLLRVGIKQYSRNGGSVSNSDGKASEKLIDDLAISIRKEIERTDPTRLKECVQEIIGLLSGNRELANSLISGKLTASAIVAISSTRPSNEMGGANGLDSSEEDSALHINPDRQRKFGLEVDSAIQTTLSNGSELSYSRQSIALAAKDLVKALADRCQDREAFEAATDAVLIEVSNYQTSVNLVTGAIKSRDLAKSLIAKSTKSQPSNRDGPLGSPKSPYPSNSSIDSADDIHQSSQPHSVFASFVPPAKRRSRLPDWAISSIEKAKKESPSRRPPSDPRRRTSSREQITIVDLT